MRVFKPFKNDCHGIVPLMKAAQLFVSKSKESNAELSSYIKDAIILLGSSIFASSQKRTYLLRKVLPSKFSNLCNANQSVSDQLFGDDVQKKMRDLPDFYKCKRKTCYHWQPYNSYWRDARYTTNLKGISETGEEIMVKMAIEFFRPERAVQKKRY